MAADRFEVALAAQNRAASAGCSVGLCIALVLWALVLAAVLVARGAGAGTAPAPASEPGPPIVQHDYLRHAHTPETGP